MLQCDQLAPADWRRRSQAAAPVLRPRSDAPPLNHGFVTSAEASERLQPLSVEVTAWREAHDEGEAHDEDQ